MRILLVDDEREEREGYCPWNEWGGAISAHETYGTEMQSYLLGQDLDTTLSNIDATVTELLEK